eukprot:TRINITY_DN1792_c0_g6_i1.p1 TRINITY_DN1792_c0_g6~~TRINITY_DN1792_c0_g6_i1.p1  ORF type:complete len:469 (-),score=120.69 TRINITY_DN1792_c0_g6_i1:84-1490(-)
MRSRLNCTRIEDSKFLNKTLKLIRLMQVDTDIENTNQSLTALGEQLEKSKAQYALFQGLVQFVVNLVDLFNEKAPEVERLEEEVMRIEAEKVQALSRITEDDVACELREATEAGDAAGAAPQRRRRRRRPLKLDGYQSSDTEDEAEVKKFADARQELLNQCGALFEDVQEEFKSIPHIKKIFEEWKTKYYDSYKQAYCALSIPSVFSPLVRRELLGWDPLGDVSFSAMDWYKTLIDFGVMKELDASDEDLNLIPLLVKSLVLPRARHAIAHCWDPLSSLQTAKARALLSELLDYVDASAPALKEIFSAALVAMHDAVEKRVHLQLPSGGRRNPGSGDVHLRQLWSSCKLLKNVLSWSDLVETSSLQHLSLDTLLNGRIVPFVRGACETHLLRPCDALCCCERVLEVVPRPWRESASEVPPALRQLADCVARLPPASTAHPHGAPRDRVIALLCSMSAHNLARQYASQA